MAATDSPSTLATRILQACLAGARWNPQDLDRLIGAALKSQEGTSALFGTLVEPLADRFDPRLVNCYVAIFSHVGERVLGLNARELTARYERICPPGRFSGRAPAVVYVLSRITLGADIAVTSVLIDAALKRFPDAAVVFAGPEKNYQLFSAEPRVQHLPISYARGALLGERLEAWKELRALIDGSDAIVLDPDSRLTQLGLLPVIDDQRYFFFESRAYGSWSEESLVELTASWCRAVLGVTGARPFFCPSGEVPPNHPETIAISLGVGGNEEKRLPDPFEAELLRRLAATGRPLLIDKGAGGEEAERVERAVRELDQHARVEVWEGTFAAFAARLARCGLYAGYDSSGQHAAAAAGVPLITVFCGYACDRTLHRWRPAGEGPVEVISVRRDDDVVDVLDLVSAALARLEPARTRRIA